MIDRDAAYDRLLELGVERTRAERVVDTVLGALASCADARELYERVARDASVDIGAARELTQIVCGAMTIDASRLPPDVAALFERRDIGSGEPPPHKALHGHTLATGKPGSAHPLSEAKAERAQSHSVVREDNPHGDTKLSSASGLSQEDAAESLATARPDDRRTIGKARG